MPNIMSIGKLICCPNIMWKGVNLVVSWVLDLLSMFKRVLLNLSIIPSDWGWYGVVLVFVIPKMCITL